MPSPLALLLLTSALAQDPSVPTARVGKAGSGMDLKQARRRTRAGQYRIGLAAAEAHLARDPGHVQARALRAEALAGLRRCRDAAPDFGATRGTPGWSARLAVLEGECALGRGDTATAEAAFSEALLLDPDAIGALHGWARSLGLRGEHDAYERALDALAEHGDAGHRDAVIRAQVAVELGMEDAERELAVLAWVAQGSARIQTRQHALVLDGVRSLDLGDPARAEVQFGLAAPLLPGRVLAGVLRAEALRRLGQAAGAALILAQPRVANQALPLRDAVQARLLVDQGEHARAAALLRALGEDSTADALASAWYLARAEGRAEDAADLARRWRLRDPNPMRALDQLLPLSEVP